VGPRAGLDIAVARTNLPLPGIDLTSLKLRVLSKAGKFVRIHEF
jgi:hypothetical protein